MQSLYRFATPTLVASFNHSPAWLLLAVVSDDQNQGKEIVQDVADLSNRVRRLNRIMIVVSFSLAAIVLLLLFASAV